MVLMMLVSDPVTRTYSCWVTDPKLHSYAVTCRRWNSKYAFDLSVHIFLCYYISPSALVYASLILDCYPVILYTNPVVGSGRATIAIIYFYSQMVTYHSLYLIRC